MKNKKLISIIVILIFIVGIVMLSGIITFTSLTHKKNISGIENYDKSYYLKEYVGDLDSNLSIFPDDKSIFKNASFSSSFQTNLFDSDGYILLIAKYNKEEYDNEINRIKELKATIYKCCKDNVNTYTNYIKYDEKSYPYPAYITIDGFGHTYEYALINEDNLEIIYVYLSYPKKDNLVYQKYLKRNKSFYSISNTVKMYSMYNHSFDNGNSFMEIGDCNTNKISENDMVKKYIDKGYELVNLDSINLEDYESFIENKDSSKDYKYSFYCLDVEGHIYENREIEINNKNIGYKLKNIIRDEYVIYIITEDNYLYYANKNKLISKSKINNILYLNKDGIGYYIVLFEDGTDYEFTLD